MRDAVAKSKAYESQLESVSIASEGDRYIEKHLAILAGNSKQGIPGIAGLQQEFSEISAKLLKQSLLEKQDKSTLDKLAINLSGIVHIRKVEGERNSEKREDIIALANSAIESGDVELAITELNKLPQPDIGTLNNWLEKSKNYVDSIAASEEILKYAIRINSQ